MALLVFWLVCSPLAAEGNTWPAFLGAGATPIQVESVPLTWDAEQNVAWKADIPGYGQSSPVVWNDLVFVTSVEGSMKDKCVVTCFDLHSGRQRWRHVEESTGKAEATQYISRAAPTPVVDAQQVIAFFESGDLVSLSHSGQPRWHISLGAAYGKIENRHGIAASPAQTEDAVFLLVDHAGPSYVLKVAKRDGRPIWKIDRESRQSWSSPAVMNIGDRQLVVVSSQGSVDGYAASDGQLVWSFDQVGGNSIATPSITRDGTVLIGASPGTQGQNAEIAAKSNLAMQVTLNDNGQVESSVKWIAERASSSFGSPMMHGGYAYWVNRTGIVHCFDAETGQRQYVERLDQPCWATPVGIGDRVYFFGRSGTTTVIRSGSRYEEIAKNRLWDAPESESQEPSAERPAGARQYGVAVVNGHLLIRTGKVLYCIRDPG